MTPSDLLAEIAEAVAAARNADDYGVKTIYVAVARNRLAAASERIRVLEISIAGIEQELARVKAG